MTPKNPRNSSDSSQWASGTRSVRCATRTFVIVTLMWKRARVCCEICQESVASSRATRTRSCAHVICHNCLAELAKDDNIAICHCESPISPTSMKGSVSKRQLKAYMEVWNEARADCNGCSNMEMKDRLFVAPCGHAYCSTCLRCMCRLALRDRLLAPVRCCKKELPVEYVRSVLPKAHDMAMYDAILREKVWQDSDLVSDSEYSKTVKKLGAKQCPGCGVGVLRDFGCIHIKCPNGHEFCYTCLRKWQTCQCSLIPEEELQHILGE